MLKTIRLNQSLEGRFSFVFVRRCLHVRVCTPWILHRSCDVVLKTKCDSMLSLGADGGTFCRYSFQTGSSPLGRRV